MSKTKEELNELKKEVESINEKLSELTEEEIAQINGGRAPSFIQLATILRGDNDTK